MQVSLPPEPRQLRRQLGPSQEGHPQDLVPRSARVSAPRCQRPLLQCARSRLCLLPQSRGRHRRVPCRLRFQSIRRRRSTGLSSLSAWHAWRTGTGIFRVHPLSAALLPFLPWTLVCSPLFQVGFLILPCLPGHPLLAALLRVRLRGFKRSPFLPGHPHLAALPRV